MFIFIALGVMCLFFCIFALIQTIHLEATNQSLQEAKIYNRTLEVMYDDLRIFRHDFSNIMQCIDGYVINNDMNGLSKYYKGIRNEFNDLNNLTSLNPNLITDPAIYSLISAKYYKAEELGISFNINIQINFEELSNYSYNLTRILGILLDNAIEAANISNEKEIYFEANRSINNSEYIISIKNTYLNKDIDIDKLCEKGYTSKNTDKNSHGLGLWEVNKIISKNKNLELHTNKSEEYFMQDVVISSNSLSVLAIP